MTTPIARLAKEQRQDRCGLVRRKQIFGREIREPGVAVRPRFDDDELLSHGLSDKAFWPPASVQVTGEADPRT